MTMNRIKAGWLVLVCATLPGSLDGRGPAQGEPNIMIPVRHDGARVGVEWMDFTPDGSRLLVRHSIPDSNDDMLRIYDAKNGREAASIRIPRKGNIRSMPSHPVSISSKGDQLLFIQQGELRLGPLDANRPTSLAESRPVKGGGYPAFVWLNEKSDGAFLGSEASSQFRLDRLDFATGRKEQVLETGNPATFFAGVTINIPAKKLALAATDVLNRNSVECWSLGPKPTKVTIHPPDEPRSVALSPDGKSVAVGFKSGPVSWYETETGRLIRTVPKFGLFPAHGLAYHPSGEFLVCGTGDRKAMSNLFVLHLATGEVVNRVIADPGGVSAICFSPKGDRLAVYGNSGDLRIWNAFALLKLE